jgi:TnpA family transposase
MVASTANATLIATYWEDVLRFTASVWTGTASASLMLIDPAWAILLIRPGRS